MELLTVVIADDHQFFRDGVRALLEAQPDMECVGEATSGAEAVRMSTELQPDVVLMDVQMPGMNTWRGPFGLWATAMPSSVRRLPPGWWTISLRCSRAIPRVAGAGLQKRGDC